ncbi:hypothetical protein OAQ23_03120 [Hellea sp.]|nr:hypothetical protein [Hellea sp.]
MKRLLLTALIAFSSPAVAQESSLPACIDKYVRDNCQFTYTFANGNKYVGEFKDNKRNGQGTFTYANGDKYIGEFKDDNMHGQGILTYADGHKYIGKWKDNKINGQGTFTYANGDKYIGEWKDDNLINGQITKTYANGDKYVREWKDGNMINGQGTYLFANGDKYVGEFKDDNMHGQGILTSDSGKQKIGFWFNNLHLSDFCSEIGLKTGTESHGQCILRYMDQLENEPMQRQPIKNALQSSNQNTTTNSTRLEQLESQQAQILAMEEERKKAAQTDAWLGLASRGLGIASGSTSKPRRLDRLVKCRKISDRGIGPVYTFKGVCGPGYAPAF